MSVTIEKYVTASDSGVSAEITDTGNLAFYNSLKPGDDYVLWLDGEEAREFLEDVLSLLPPRKEKGAEAPSLDAPVKRTRSRR